MPSRLSNAQEESITTLKVLGCLLQTVQQVMLMLNACLTDWKSLFLVVPAVMAPAQMPTLSMYMQHTDQVRRYMSNLAVVAIAECKEEGRAAGEG